MKSTTLKERVRDSIAQPEVASNSNGEVQIANPEKKAGKEAKAGMMELPKYDFKTMVLTVVGMTPLIVHAWSAKNAKRMLDVQTKVASRGREKRDPIGDFRESLYPILDGKTGEIVDFGVPSTAFKACIVSGANDVDLKMTEIKRTVHVDFNTVPLICPPLERQYFTEWDTKEAKQLAFEHSKGCSMRQDFCRNDNGSADLRFRGCFPIWKCRLQIQFNRSVISEEQLVNLVRISGWGVGICEWRPSAPYVRSGEFGRFTVDDTDKMEVY